ncbi:GtrA family protein [Prochlorococcus marinus]|uniref:GtrA family protein n=1 Tax=Prochlorococcus marinus TaxID=1219 RepID=UPI0022B36314|nr:GtrA family protein [Prochlorococcus marinus]
MNHEIKFIKYSIISGFGLLSSVIIFYICQSILELKAYSSNIIGDISALIFVYIISWYYIFDHEKLHFKRKLLIQTLAKIIVINIISFILLILEANLLPSLTLILNQLITKDLILSIIKLIISPFSLLANYIITYGIIEKYFTGRK